ncbi:MAG: hypothetical protein R2729_12985 [Bryobacteraceae bacterium]
MATERQIAANRRNAQLSTGPRTESGKAKSARNSLRHGLYATDAVVHAVGETGSAFRAHFAAFLATALDPADPVENSLLKNVASLDWQISRNRRQEAGSADFVAQELWDRSVAGSDNPDVSPTFGPFDDPDRGHNRLAGLAFIANTTASDSPEKISRIQHRHYGAYFRALKTLADYRNKPNSKSRKLLQEKENEVE